MMEVCSNDKNKLYVKALREMVAISARVFYSFDLVSEEWSSENSDAKSLLYYHSGHRESNLLSWILKMLPLNATLF